MNIKLLLHHPLQWLRDLQSSPSHEQAPSVALVLSGGGARGLAQIGAIEELQARGYHIHAVAGTSMGALVGGFFCCGKLGLLKTRVLSLKRKEVMQLIDFSIGLDHVATADHLLTLMQQLLDNVRIENLPVNFCCCASDLTSGRERVFREGPLADAIRASISIPGFFKPVRNGNEALVDGSVHNIFPLDRVERKPGDMLIGINVSAPDSRPCNDYIDRNDESVGRFLSWLRTVLPVGHRQLSANALNMALRVACLTLQNNTQVAMRLTPPDLCVNVPMDTFGLFDYERAAEIIAYGRRATAQALDQKLAP